MNRTRSFAVLIVAAVLVPVLLRAQEPQGVETFDAVWTIVRDTHFDRTMNGVNWTAVRDELRPRAAAAKNPGELRAVLHDMLGRLGQSHFAVIPFSPDSTSAAAGDLRGDPGLDVRLVGRDLLVTRVEEGGGAAVAGVRPGWKLTAIESRPASDLLTSVLASANERLRNVEDFRRLIDFCAEAGVPSVMLLPGVLHPPALFLSVGNRCVLRYTPITSPHGSINGAELYCTRVPEGNWTVV